MVEEEDLCQRLRATGESTLEKLGLHCWLPSSSNWLAGLGFTGFTAWVLHSNSSSRGCWAYLALQGIPVPGLDVPVLSVTWSCWCSGTNWCMMALSGVDKVLVLTPFLFLLGFLLAFFSLVS